MVAVVAVIVYVLGFIATAVNVTFKSARVEWGGDIEWEDAVFGLMAGLVWPLTNIVTGWVRILRWIARRVR